MILTSQLDSYLIYPPSTFTQNTHTDTDTCTHARTYQLLTYRNEDMSASLKHYCREKKNKVFVNEQAFFFLNP